MGHEQIRDLMTPNPTTLPSTATALDAARVMRADDIGDIIVLEGDRIAGIVTDRDIVVRALGTGRNPAETPLGEICSRRLTVVSPTDAVASALELMREKAIRRLPVVEDGRPVGIVSLGDLADEEEGGAALGGISAAPPNR
jgi:CBS domain-containing protein